jgi:hypothetical protein
MPWTTDNTFVVGLLKDVARLNYIDLVIAHRVCTGWTMWGHLTKSISIPMPRQVDSMRTCDLTDLYAL